MGLQPSASKTDLLLACQRPFDPEIAIERDEADEPMRYGSAFHEVIAQLIVTQIELESPKRLPELKPLRDAMLAKMVDGAASRYEVKHLSGELAAHVKAAAQYLWRWIVKQLPPGPAQIEVEQSYAISPFTEEVRKIPLPTFEEHRYEELKDREIAGTADLIIRAPRKTIVLDHKTGIDMGFALPAKLPQMRTLGLIPEVDEPVEVAIFHADRKGLPVVYTDVYELESQRAHRKALRNAFRRVGDGSMRPGPYCSGCPAAPTCPAKSAELISNTTSALIAAGIEKITVANGNAHLSRGDQAGRLYVLLKAFRKLDESASPEIRRLVEEGEIVELPDGSTLELSEEQPYEWLSKASVIRALGRKDGERELERLRKKGAIEQKERRTLRVRPGR